MDGQGRQHEALTIDCNKHAIDDGQGERQQDRECGPLTDLRDDLDPAPQPSNAAPDRIETHTAAGDIGEDFGRRKARQKDQGEKEIGRRRVGKECRL